MNDVQIWQALLISLVPAVLVAIITAYITVYLSLKQFRKQRWWERKAEAYTKIIESLYHLIEFCDAHEKEDREGLKIYDERHKQLEREYSLAYDELTKATNIGSFIIRKDAVKYLKDLSTRDKGNWQTDPAWEIYASDAKNYRKALEQIREIAKKDLNVD